MGDIVDAATRSRMMRGIRAKNTRPEIAVRKALHTRGFRFRIHDRRLPGTPDIVLPRHKVTVFISGCFWHGHDCPLFKLPATRTDFWLKKINTNRAKDLRTTGALSDLGWRQAIVWECALRGRSAMGIEAVSDALETWVRSGGQSLMLRGET